MAPTIPAIMNAICAAVGVPIRPLPAFPQWVRGGIRGKERGMLRHATK